jgi:LacI family transcriptional regulator, repressor for deo operon, udp, cdd, tsx, nupC, and nupG
MNAAPDLPSVHINDDVAVLVGLSHLLDLGHRRIGFVGGGEDHELCFEVPTVRRDAYQSALEMVGLPFSEDLVVEGDFTVAGGVAAGRKFFAKNSPPTAILAASDEMAIGVMWAAQEQGIRVPEQLSVVGIDDHVMSEAFGLTTVAQPVSRLAQVATEQLLEMIAGEPGDAGDQILPVGLLERSSTARPSRESQFDGQFDVRGDVGAEVMSVLAQHHAFFKDDQLGVPPNG